MAKSIEGPIRRRVPDRPWHLNRLRPFLTFRDLERERALQARLERVVERARREVSCRARGGPP